MTLDIKSAAKSYLELWARIDRSAMSDLSKGTPVDCEDQRLAVQKIAGEYKVARNLRPREPEVLRLEKATRGLLSVERPTNDDEAFQTVRAYTRRLFDDYEQVTESAATKFLWMRFQSPIVIYDSLAYGWLYRNKSHLVKLGYDCYLEVWQAAYNDLAPLIERTCSTLADTEIQSIITCHQVGLAEARIALQSAWFHERVFDHAILEEERVYVEAQKQARRVP